MAEEKKQLWCPTCKRSVVAARSKPNRWAHGAATVLTGGLWAPVWLLREGAREIVHMSHPGWMCTACGCAELMGSPATEEENAESPGSYKIIGVDRESENDVELVIDAASSANAIAKAELRGIMVTDINRVDPEASGFQCETQANSTDEILKAQDPDELGAFRKKHLWPDVKLLEGTAIAFIFLAVLALFFWNVVAKGPKASYDPTSGLRDKYHNAAEGTSPTTSMDRPEKAPSTGSVQFPNVVERDVAASDRVAAIKAFEQRVAEHLSKAAKEGQTPEIKADALDIERERNELLQRFFQREQGRFVSNQNGMKRADRTGGYESRPLLYPEGGQQDWSKGTRGPSQSIWGYEIPTDPHERGQYFRDMEAENDRLEQELIRDGLLDP